MAGGTLVRMAVDVSQAWLVRNPGEKRRQYNRARDTWDTSDGDTACFADGVGSVLWWAVGDVDFGPATGVPDLPVDEDTVLEERRIFAQRAQSASVPRNRQVHAVGALSAIDWLLGLKDDPLDELP